MRLLKNLAEKTAIVFIFTMVATTGFSDDSLCSREINSLSNIVHHEGAMLFQTSIENASAISGVSVEELNWLKSSKPLFTVLAGDHAIPYFEFGPGLEEKLSTPFGSTVKPLKGAIEIVDPDGRVSRFELPTVHDFGIAKPAATLEHKGDMSTEAWWFFIPPAAGAIGGTACWAAAQLCWERCENFVRSCECGGECNCGRCATSPSVACHTCPFVPPRDSIWLP